MQQSRQSKHIPEALTDACASGDAVRLPNIAYPSHKMRDHSLMTSNDHIRGSFDMFVKLGSTVVPVYLRYLNIRFTKGYWTTGAYFRNSIKVRFVKTMLVESQSSIPTDTNMRRRICLKWVDAYQGWTASPSLSTCRPRQKG
jgi:hypothetical protein